MGLYDDDKFAICYPLSLYKLNITHPPTKGIVEETPYKVNRKWQRIVNITAEVMYVG